MSDYKTEVLALSPAGYWRLGEDTGTNAVDEVGANDGTYNNTPTLDVTGLLTDDLDTAVTFARTSSEDVTMGDVLDFAYNEPFTLCAWINSSDTTNAQGIIGKQAIPAKGYSMYLSGGNLVGTVLAAYTTNGIRKITTATIADGVDHFVVMTYDGSTNASGLKIYVDNVLQATTTTFDNLTSSISHTETFAVGSLESTDNYMEGEIDEAAVFGAELTAQEVARLYYAGLGKLDRYELDVLSLSPVGYWRLGESGGTNAVDEVGANDGTYTNTPTLDVEGAISEDLDTAVTFLASSSEHVAHGDVLDFDSADPWTATGWFKTASAAFSKIVCKEQAGDPYRGWGLGLSSGGEVTFIHRNTHTTNYISVVTDAAYNDDAWHFAVVTYDGSTDAAGVTIYIDGVAVDVTVGSDNLSATTVNSEGLNIGGRSATDSYFDGELDEVAVFDYELSALEQLFLYDSGTYVSPPAGLDADYRNTVLALRPAGYWRLGEDTGTNAADEMRRNDGTYVNTPVLGVLGSLTDDTDTAVTFDSGSSEHVTMGDVLDFATGDPMTLMCWFKTTISGATGEMITKLTTSTPVRGYAIKVFSDGTLFFVVTNTDTGPNRIKVSTNASYNDGNWHHAVATYDGSLGGGGGAGVTWYIDGEVVASTINDTTLDGGETIANAADLNLAARDGTDGFFPGTLDEAAIFAYELTAKEVAALYYKGIGKQDYEYEVLKLNPLGYWRLGEDTGTNAVDETVNANDGTYVNTPTLGVAGAIVEDVDTAVSFAQASSEYVDMGDVFAFEYNDPFSLSCWFKTTYATASVLMGKQGSSGNSRGYALIMVADGGFQFQLSSVVTTTDFALTTPSDSYNDDNWHHVVVTYDGSTDAAGVTLYLDGVSIALTIARNNLGSNTTVDTTSFNLASRNDGALQDFDGELDEAAVFGTELTAQEAHDMYTYGMQYRTALSSFDSAMWQARPIGWWKLGESVGTNAADETGNNDGTYVNTPTLDVAGAISSSTDTAVSFLKASDEYVDMGDVLDFDYTEPFSISCWFKTSYSATYGFLVSKELEASTKRGYALVVTDDGGVQLQIVSTITTNDISIKTDTVGFNDDNWHHAVATYDGSAAASGINIYVDGVNRALTALRDGLSATTVNAASFNIAGRDDSTAEVFDGEIDEAAVFDHELTGAEVRRIYWEAAGYSRYALAQLVNSESAGYWRLGELEGTNAVDATGNNDGTYNNTPTLAEPSLIPNDDDTAVTFLDTSSEDVTMGDVLDFAYNVPFSLSAWINTLEGAASIGIVGKYDAPGNKGYALYMSNGTLIGIVVSTYSSNGIRHASVQSIADGIDHFLTVTYDGSTNGSGLKLYIDGVQVATATAFDNLSASIAHSDPVAVGSLGGTANYFDGTIDDAAIYAGELTANQVADMYIAGLLSYTDTSGGEQYIEAVTDAPTMEGLIGATANHAVVDATNVVEVLTTYWGRTVSESFNWEVGIGLITTLTESFSTSTSISTLRNQLGAIVESVQFALTENIEHAKGILEGLAMNEAWAASAILQGNLSETLTYADVIQLTWDQLQTETVNVTDTSAPYAQKAAALAELFVAAGIVDTLYKAAGIIAEAVILQDLVERYFELSAVDSVTMTDVEANLYRAVAANIESAAMADALSGTRRLSLLVSDDLTSGDVDVATAVCNALATDRAIFGGAITLPDGVFSAIVLNTESLGISEYANYPFNSFGKLDNDYLGASDTDIFQLTGDDDDGTDIDAVIRTGMTNFGTNVFKRVPRAYLGYTSNGGLILKTISTSGGTKTERWYELTPRTGDHASDAHAAARIKLGRGIKATYWQFELINKLGSDFDIDMLQLYPMILSRRV